MFVEDEVGKSIIMNLIPLRTRERVKVYVIGSDQAILKQMAARYREMKMNFISFLDGDKRPEHTQQIRQIKNHLESRIDDEQAFQTIIGAKLCYIPGDTWPEMSIMQYLLRAPNLDGLVERWDVPAEDIRMFLEQAMMAGKHKEFFHLAELLAMDESSVRNDCIKLFKAQYPNECRTVCELIDGAIANL